jgi:hypothetical protein
MGRTGSGTNTIGYPPTLGNSRVHSTNPASANPQVHSRGNRSGWITHGGILALQRGEEVKNNAKDFEPLHRTHDHAGLLLYYDQKLPDNDPEGLARTVDEVFNQYGSKAIRNELVDLDEWYDWLQE